MCLDDKRSLAKREGSVNLVYLIAATLDPSRSGGWGHILTGTIAIRRHDQRLEGCLLGKEEKGWRILATHDFATTVGIYVRELACVRNDFGQRDGQTRGYLTLSVPFPLADD